MNDKGLDFKHKEVINIKTGEKLGFVLDVNADLETGKITSIIVPGSTKLFNLFIGHLIFYSPYFPENTVKKVKHFLHVPLDKKVFDVLKACSVKNVPALIKDVTEASYYNLQNTIRSSALRYRIPPLHFDEYGWAFDKV